MPKRLILLACAALLLSACAAQKDIQILDSRLESVESKSQEIANRIEKANEPVRSKQAELYADVQSLRSDLAQAKGEIEVLKRQVDELEQVQKANNQVLANAAEDVKDMRSAWSQASSQLGLDIDLEKIRAERQKTLVPAPPADAAPPAPTVPGEPAAPGAKAPAEAAPATPPAAEPAAPANAPSVSTAAPADPSEAAYHKAREAFEARKYADAQTMWDDFATKNPNHQLVPNAIFWQGESYYQLGDYARAILKYQDVIDKYAKSDKYRSAVLKQGMSFIKLGRDKAGKVLLQDLIKKYPDSVEAKRAKSVLGQ